MNRHMELLGVVHFGWFASGALFYIAFRNSDRALMASAFAVAVGSALTWRLAGEGIRNLITYPESVLALLVVAPLFIAPFIWSTVRFILESRVIVFMGFISYPLYLIHLNISHGVISVLVRYIPNSYWSLVPLIPILVLVWVSWMIAKYIEPELRRLLRVFLPPRRMTVEH